MVSLDINISSVHNPIAQGVKEANAHEADVMPEEDQAENTAEEELSENVTFGHNFPIDLSFLFKKRKKSTDIFLDVKNSGEKCFLYCIAAALQSHKFKSKSEKEDPSNYSQFITEELNTDGIDFPIKIDQVQHFVNKNMHKNLCINIYTIFGTEIKSLKTNITSKEKNSFI